jgi:hypothetical protein
VRKATGVRTGCWCEIPSLGIYKLRQHHLNNFGLCCLSYVVYACD